MKLIGTALFVIGILGLFWLERDRKSRTSKALWIPVIWVLISGSRMVTEWLGVGLSMGTPDQYLDGSPLDRNILMGLLAVAVVILVRRGPRVAALLRANGAILLFFAYCLVSILWSDYPDVAFKRWIKALGDPVMILVVLSDRDVDSAIKRLLTRTGFLLAPISVLLIKYYPEWGRGYDRWVGTAMYTGVTTSKNLLGMVCLVLGLGCAWRCLDAFRKGIRPTGPLIANAVCLGMILWLFDKANSATSLSCMCLGGGVMVLTSLFSFARKPKVVHVLVVAAISVAFSALFLDLGSGLVQTMGRDPTLTGRTAVWDLVLGLVENPLLGTGYDSFWLGKRLATIWSVYWWQPNEAHNGYIDLYLNLGWVGIILLAVIMLSGYRRIVDAVQRQETAANLRLAYFVATVVYNFTEAAVKKMHPVWIFFLLAIMAVPKARAGKTRVPKVSKSWAESSLQEWPAITVQLPAQEHPIISRGA